MKHLITTITLMFITLVSFGQNGKVTVQDLIEIVDFSFLSFENYMNTLKYVKYKTDNSYGETRYYLYESPTNDSVETRFLSRSMYPNSNDVSYQTKLLNEFNDLKKEVKLLGFVYRNTVRKTDEIRINYQNGKLKVSFLDMKFRVDETFTEHYYYVSVAH